MNFLVQVQVWLIVIGRESFSKKKMVLLFYFSVVASRLFAKQLVPSVPKNIFFGFSCKGNIKLAKACFALFTVAETRNFYLVER